MTFYKPISFFKIHGMLIEIQKNTPLAFHRAHWVRQDLLSDCTLLPGSIEDITRWREDMKFIFWSQRVTCFLFYRSETNAQTVYELLQFGAGIFLNISPLLYFGRNYFNSSKSNYAFFFAFVFSCFLKNYFELALANLTFHYSPSFKRWLVTFGSIATGRNDVISGRKICHDGSGCNFVWILQVKHSRSVWKN